MNNDFVAKAQMVHGDKYDYSKVEYVNSATKVCIICHEKDEYGCEHGEFWQIANNHLSGCGCPKCKQETLKNLKMKNTESFIINANKIHNFKYNYSKTEYKGSGEKVCIICPKHGEFWQIANDHLRGCGCPKCAGIEKSTTEQFITKAKKIHGNEYDYSKVDYKNNRTKVCIICPEHGEFWQTPKSHLNGAGCPKCARKIVSAKNTSNTEEFIKKAKEIHGDVFDYSKVNYINNKTKVCIICYKKDKNGVEYGEFWQKPCDHLYGSGFPRIILKSRHQKVKKNFICNTCTFIKKAKEIHGDKYDYSKVNYVNANTKIKIVCPKHGEFWQKPHNHLKGSGCPKCGVEQRVKFKSYTTEQFIKKAREIHGDKYDYSKTKYISSDKEVEIICPKHGSFWQIATDHLQGSNCPHCANHVSKGENEICEFLKGLKFQVEKNNRTVIKPKEIDIYIPEKKLAIEYDGLIWHSEKYGKDKNYHLKKTIECENSGIRLIHIFEDEWINKGKIIKSKLSNCLNRTNNKIYARKCKIKNVNPHEAMEFLEKNHLQGKCKAKYHYGLYYDNELVSLMTFGAIRQQRKYNENYDKTFELLRFCNKLNTVVVGGASKLLKHFIKEIAPYEIITYADRRWSQGGLYEKLGFIHSHNSLPNYFYVIGGHRENRFKYRKGNLVKQGFDKNLSEHQIMTKRGIYRIYDCGTMVYKLKPIYNK